MNKIRRYCNNHYTTVLDSYVNGNHRTYIFSNGTRIRVLRNPFSRKLTFDFAENCDVKITNYCDANCKYCHEGSSKKGKHGTLYENGKLLNIFETWKKGTEMAIGGGNALDHPELYKFLTEMAIKGVICNLTVNQKHLVSHADKLKFFIKCNLIKGLGISLNTPPSKEEVEVIEELKKLTSNIVFHVIVGIYDAWMMEYLEGQKVLILGYKDNVGRGIKFKENNGDILDHFKDLLIKHLTMVRNLKLLWGFDYYKTLSFDNLAIKQLDVKNVLKLSDREWKKRFQGKDYGDPNGENAPSTFYFDAVKKEIARSSTQPLEQRIPYTNQTYEEAFKVSLSNYNKE